METCPLQPGWKEPKSKVRQAKARKSNRAV
jgi:hypothetical protein